MNNHVILKNHQELNFSKKIHRFGHVSAEDMEALLKATGYDKKEACRKLAKACAVCATSGRPKDRNKNYTTHVNTAFNEEIQANFLYILIRGKDMRC